MQNVNIVKAVRVENVIVKTDYKIDPNGEELVYIGEEGTGREREALKFGLGKAKRLLQALNNDPEGFIDELVAYVHRREGKILASKTPTKTLEFDGTLYGLFSDGAIKHRQERNGKLLWATVKGRMASIITAESFDDPESLSVAVKAVKAVKAPKASATNAALEAMQAKLDAQAEQNAKLQAMMMQFLQAQTAGA